MQTITLTITPDEYRRYVLSQTGKTKVWGDIIAQLVYERCGAHVWAGGTGLFFGETQLCDYSPEAKELMGKFDRNEPLENDFTFTLSVYQSTRKC